MIKINNPLGCVSISGEAVGKIVGIAATSCYGVVGMASKSATEGIAMLLGKDQYEKGVKVTLSEGSLEIDLHIIVTYGINIKAITQSIVHKVRYKTEELTGFLVSRVNVYVDDMKL